MGEWTPRGGQGGDSAGPRRGEASRWGDRRAERPEFGRPAEFGGSGEGRWQRRPERGGRFERRPDAGRPPRSVPNRLAGARPAPARSTGARSTAPRGAEGYGASRVLPAGGSRPRPPAELLGLERRGVPGRPAESPEGEHFAAAAPSDLIWGRHSAQAALESGRPIHRIWCTPEMRFSPRFLQLLREAKAGGVLVEEVTWARLGQISGGAVHQGIVLQPAAADTLDLASLIEGCRGTGESPLLIAVDGLTDPQNLGAIVRSAEALGAHGLVLPQRRNAGLTGSVAKVAAGALEHLPVARVVNLNRSLETLKDEGYRVIGLASEGNLTLEEADLDGPLVVVTGSEADGLSLLTRRHCDQLVRIPLRGTTPSLNASVATALLLYEIARRGWMHGLRGNSPAPRLVRPSLPAPAAASEPAGPLPSAAEEPSTPAEAADQFTAALADQTAGVLSHPPATIAAPGAAALPIDQAGDQPVEEEPSTWHAALGAEPELAGPEPSRLEDASAPLPSRPVEAPTGAALSAVAAPPAALATAEGQAEEAGGSGSALPSESWTPAAEAEVQRPGADALAVTAEAPPAQPGIAAEPPLPADARLGDGGDRADAAAGVFSFEGDIRL